MKLIPVDAIPKMGGYHKLQELIEEFVNGDAKIVKVVFGEDDYKSPSVMPVLSGRCRQEVKAFGQGMAAWKRSVSKQGYLTKDRAALTAALSFIPPSSIALT